MSHRRLATLAFLALSMFAPGGAAAAGACDRFAAPGGSDADPGTEARPYRSAKRLSESLRVGETGCLRAGTYPADRGDFVAEFERAGRPGAPITLRSAPGERARLVGIVYVESGADHVHIAGLDIVGTGVQNTIKVYADDTVIEDNDITNRMRGDSCMILGSSSGGRARRTVVRRNTFHDCGAMAHDNHDHSIYAADVESARIVDNTFFNSAAYTIQLYPNADRSTVARNVIDGGPDTVRGGIVIGGDSRSTSDYNVVERNVITHAATYSVTGFWERRVGAGNVARKNCSWSAGDDAILAEGFRARRNVTADPLFRDPARGDYRLGVGSGCSGVIGAAAAAFA